MLTAGGVVTNGAAGQGYALIEGGVGVVAQGAAAATIINYGLIEGTGGTAVSFAAAGDVLIAEAGSSFISALAGGGGSLSLLAGAATGTVDGLSGFGSVSFAAGPSWSFEGADTIAGGLDVSGGTVVLAGTLSDGGVGSTSVYFAAGVDRLVVEAGAALVGAAVAEAPARRSNWRPARGG